MLHQLNIQNFAILDQLQVELAPGLNVITGETGTGKSILIDAVGALLGDRLGPEVVRSGASRALIEGVFVVEPVARPELQAVLDEFGLEPDDGALIVTRDIAGAGGRGGARVNGRSVPLAVIESLGELLVDVHGQSQHMALLRAREQLDYLDRFAAALPARGQVQRLVRELRATREARQALQSREREAARTADMLRHEIREISAANLSPTEESELLVLRERLQHVERLRQAALTAYAALSGTDDADAETPGAVDLLGQAITACQDGARFDAALGAEFDALNTVLAQAEESARTLRDYLDNLEADPSELERITERLFLVGDLKRKYGASVEEVLAYARDAEARLDDLEHRAERLDELSAEEHRLLGGLADAACALSKMRHTAAARLSQAVEREFADLRLAGTRFEVSLTSTEASEGVPVSGRTLAFDTSGIDHVEFLLAASGSGEPRPLSKVASGGELARVALALKTILARAETRPTLIFDEIDVGVGGRTAPVVGQKLWTVATAGRQVLCVTHMPQVAAFADVHYAVSREPAGSVRVTRLDDAARAEELALMLAGSPSDAARQSAQELLTRAEAFKRRTAH